MDKSYQSDIVQLDGNMTILSDIPDGTHMSCESGNSIPVQISERMANQNIPTFRNPIRKLLPRNNKIEASSYLPIVGVTNFRSLAPKINNVKTDILEREIDLILCSETWQKDSNRRLNADIETMLEIDGLEFISCPRPSNKRGGGCAVIVKREKFTVEKLHIIVPHKLEVVWCLVRPRNVTTRTEFREDISCAFYSPPNYRKNGKLAEHIIFQIHHLLTKYPRAGYICGGDKNSMPLGPIINALPKCKQIVTKNTYKQRKIYDVILTNMSHLYSVPYIAPAVQPDLHGHSPSDHDTAVAVPLAGAGAAAVTREYTVRESRPLPDSAIREFGQWMSQTDWSRLDGDMSPTIQAQVFQNTLQDNVDFYFPTKKCRISNTDKPFITKELKRLDRWKKVEYVKHGKSIKYYSILATFDKKYKQAAAAHLEKNVRDLMEAAPGRAWATLKKMGAQPGDCGDDGSFTLSEHLDEKLTTSQSLARIVDYFSGISCEYLPLTLDLLPDTVQLNLIWK
jgi:hypothetical protein